jgi:hypothetical protein
MYHNAKKYRLEYRYRLVDPIQYPILIDTLSLYRKPPWAPFVPKVSDLLKRVSISLRIFSFSLLRSDLIFKNSNDGEDGSLDSHLSPIHLFVLTVVAFISSNDIEERPPFFEGVLYLNEETIEPETDLDTQLEWVPGWVIIGKGEEEEGVPFYGLESSV